MDRANADIKHAIGKFRSLEIPFNPIRPDVKERVGEKFFYEDEFYVELGYSYENAVSLQSPNQARKAN